MRTIAPPTPTQQPDIHPTWSRLAPPDSYAPSHHGSADDLQDGKSSTHRLLRWHRRSAADLVFVAPEAAFGG
jgi:hypothetical protein